MIKIAVLGYGTIGSGVVEVLETNREHITQTAGQEIEVKYVLDLRDFPGDPIQEKIVHDYEIIKNMFHFKKEFTEFNNPSFIFIFYILLLN